MQQMDFRLETKNFDDVRGTFEAFASVYGNVDLHGDVVDAGAFTKTIQERPVVKLLLNHDPNRPVGLGRLIDTPRGLKVAGELNLDTELGREVYSNLKRGILDAMSIGYDVVKHGRNGAVRHLKELKLWEVSIVTFPANQLAVVTHVKAQTGLDSDTFSAMLRLTEQMQADLKRINARGR